MATSTSRPIRNSRRLPHSYQPQHQPSRRPHRTNLSNIHANFCTRSKPDTAVGEFYPVRRRIVANQMRSFVSSVNTNQSNYPYPHLTGSTDATIRRRNFVFTRSEDRRSEECCYPPPTNQLEPVAEMTQLSFQAQDRRLCDDVRNVTHYPQSTHSPTRLQPESGCPGALRATWSWDPLTANPG